MDTISEQEKSFWKAAEAAKREIAGWPEWKKEAAAQAAVTPDTGSVCVAWGPLGERLKHLDCPVVLTEWRQASGGRQFLPGPLPITCPCDCRTCKRAWWGAGRP